LSNSGIPSNIVRTIAIDSLGNKWLGSTGLTKFDDTTWTNYNMHNSGIPENAVYSIAVDDLGNKWIGTFSAGLVKFDNTNWVIYNTSNSDLPDNFIRCIVIDGVGNKWIGTNGGGLAKFNNSNWTIYNTTNSGLPNNYILDIFIDKYKNLWIATEYGGVAVFQEGGIVSVKEDKYDHNQNAKDFKLNQNYPNPFNPSTKIGYALQSSGWVTLKIFDNSGKKIHTLVNEYQRPKEYAIKFNATDLASGIYFYQLNVENQIVETKKMILIK